MNELIAITCATDKHKASALIESAERWGWKLIILQPETNIGWKNINKLLLLNDYLQNIGNKLVLFLDGYDTVIQNSTTSAYDYYHANFSGKLIIGDESFYKTPSLLYKLGLRFPYGPNIENNNCNLSKTLGLANLKHNTGAILGNAEDFISLLKEIIPFYKENAHYSSDQALIGDWARCFPEKARELISLQLHFLFWHVGINPSPYRCKINWISEKPQFIVKGKVPLVIHRTSLRVKKYKKHFNFILKKLNMQPPLV